MAACCAARGVALTGPQVVPLAIESIAAGGDGVARRNGLVVFVPRTAPGDVVTARVSGRGAFARGRLVAVAKPSPDRIEPPCPHYTRDRCGGCQIQHMTYDSQLHAKQRIVADAIHRIGKRDFAPSEPARSPSEWRYRLKLTLTMRRKETGRWVAGLHRYDDPGRIFAIEDCPITDRRVVSAWRGILAHSEFFPSADELRGSVRWMEDGPAFVLAGGRRWSRSSDFFEAAASLAVAWWDDDRGVRRLVGDRRGNRARRAPSASFAQVNADVAANLRSHLITMLLRYQPETLVDAYSGSGETAIALARQGMNVTAIELDSDAAAWAAAHLPEGSRSLAGRVEDLLHSALPADAVVLNPPRAGLDTNVTAALESVALRPRVVAYVSCNPATLARDIARLPGYRIESLVPFDMFPQTAHVESVCELVPDVA